jgi:hypothetical protein
MPSLQVRDFPVDLYEGLKSRAKQEHRSISQQAIVAIREHVADGVRRAQDISLNSSPRCVDNEDARARIERRKRILAEIHATPKPKLPPDFPSTLELLHEGREER